MGLVVSDKEIQNLLRVLKQSETEENPTKQENEERGEEEDFSEMFQEIGPVLGKKDIESFLNDLKDLS